MYSNVELGGFSSGRGFLTNGLLERGCRYGWLSGHFLGSVADTQGGLRCVLALQEGRYGVDIMWGFARLVVRSVEVCG